VEIWAKYVNTFAKSLDFYQNGTQNQNADVFMEIIFFGVFFGQVWGNLGKYPSHPQKFACSYTYALKVSWEISLYGTLKKLCGKATKTSRIICTEFARVALAVDAGNIEKIPQRPFWSSYEQLAGLLKALCSPVDVFLCFFAILYNDNLSTISHSEIGHFWCSGPRCHFFTSVIANFQNSTCLLIPRCKTDL